MNPSSGGTELTDAQKRALRILRQAAESPDTWTGIVSTETYFDPEIYVGYIHYRTADSLRRRGLVEYGERDPEWGTEIRLAAA